MAAATATVGTTDFVVHYNSASVDAGTATGLANDAQNGRNLELNPPYSFPPRKLQLKLSRRLKKGRYSLTLTPQSVNFVPGTPVSAGRVSVPKPPKAKKRTSRRARFIY